MGETHECPLEGATHFGCVSISGGLYIDCVMTITPNHYEAKRIKPLPIPFYLRPSDDRIQPTKNRSSDEEAYRTQFH
ncbi:hypothetical protein [Nitrososphaera sp. AFS]|uniref:hypothetical protein n=1 Tax=Nitrososphaera sp. AFS TaxID=2301191 RepID=UPI0013923E54|nr:hypothetical protein [Nitrososphaera sp. AFS]